MQGRRELKMEMNHPNTNGGDGDISGRIRCDDQPQVPPSTAAAGNSSSTLRGSSSTTLPSSMNAHDLPDWVGEFTSPQPSRTCSTCHGATRRSRDNNGKATTSTEESSASASASASYAGEQSPFELLLSSNAHASNAILINLTVPDIITSFALVSKSARKMTLDDGLWYAKFVLRWTVMPDPVWTVKESAGIVVGTDDVVANCDEYKCDACNSDATEGETGPSQVLRQQQQKIPGLTDSDCIWYRSYRNAHRNPHDLWLTHWNCALPHDGTSPGRCAVPDLKFVPDTATADDGDCITGASSYASPTSHASSVQQGREDDGYDSPLMRKCPTCRHHPVLNPRLAEMESALDAELNFAGDRSSVCCEGDELTAGIASPVVDPIMKTRVVAKAHSLLLHRDFGPRNEKHDADNDDLSRYDISTTPAKAIFRSSLYSAAKWARNLRESDGLDLAVRSNPEWDARPMDGCYNLSVNSEKIVEVASQEERTGVRNSIHSAALRRMAKRRSIASSAFKAASTYHRKIDPDQFRSSGLQFMKDALFFNVQPTHEKVLEEGGWIGSNACPVGRRRAKEAALDEEKGMDRGHDQEYNGNTNTEESLHDDGDNECCDEENMSELEKALRDVYGDEVMDLNAAALPTDATAPPPLEPNIRGTLSSRGDRHDTALHTWHVARLSNPDHFRPITFRVYVQRPDCFTVYPSSGYLRPGDSCNITFGIRALGSIITEAYESINAGREEIDTILADIYSREAHLPYAPFAIRYMFAPAPPCVPPGYKARVERNSSVLTGTGGAPTTSSGSSAFGGRDMIDYLWDSVACETDVRTIYVSAHVNGNYGFDEFMVRALLPFEVRPDTKGGPTFLAPNLKYTNPDIYSCLNNMELETVASTLGDIYRTERACISCGRSWGARSEELGRAFLLNRLVCDRYSRLRELQMSNSLRALRFLPRLIDSVLTNRGSDCQNLLGSIYQITFHLNAILLLKRADRCLTRPQRSMITSYEVVLNDLLFFIQANVFELTGLLDLAGDASCFDTSCINTDESTGTRSATAADSHSSGSNKNAKLPRPWRHGGLYRYLRCTDSVFSHENEVFEDGKSEPDYLQSFCNLWHNPGWYRLGLQDDPNHMDEQELGAVGHKPKRFQRINWRHADVFKQDAAMALVCAMSMIHDPRALLVHGIYDRTEPPGTVCRRPRSETLGVFCLHAPCSDDRLLSDALRVVEIFERGKKQRAARLFVKKTKPFIHPGQKRKVERSLQSTLKRVAILGWKAADFDLNDVDHEGISFLSEGFIEYASTYEQYLQNIPPAGVGRNALSAAISSRLRPTGVGAIADARVGRQDVQTVDVGEINDVGRWPSDGTTTSRNRRHRPSHRLQQQGPAREQRADEGNVNQGGPRIINLLWLISSHLGWTVDDDRKPGAVLVERGILIATQWLSNTLFALPLFLTLIARYFRLITPSPLDYHLEGLPYVELKQMKYLSADECGYAAIVVVMLYLALGRFSERNVCRTFERAMMEQVPDPRYEERPGAFGKFYPLLVLRLQRIYDSVTPRFLQNATFSPNWNRRGRRDVASFVIKTKGVDFREHKSSFDASHGRGGGTIDTKSLHLDGTLQPNISFRMKALIGFLVSLGSFCACSPHFSLNLFTVFYSGIAMGLSMSLQYMEIGNGSLSPGRIFKPMRLNVVIVTSFLFGQLVGSSGGVLFLAEFIVTTISLLLGGAATVSTNAAESWITFFFLSSASFCGYLFARVALVDNSRNKRGGIPSSLLLLSLVVLSFLTVFALFYLDWQIPMTLMIERVD
mmetsp:Transcript_8536/g.19279  ORF Transcript_8536/g.19279 Transcript_8536/m.19279 type:complete len:1782 (+) Transcript_8536:111-5456(+)